MAGSPIVSGMSVGKALKVCSEDVTRAASKSRKTVSRELHND